MEKITIIGWLNGEKATLTTDNPTEAEAFQNKMDATEYVTSTYNYKQLKKETK